MGGSPRSIFWPRLVVMLTLLAANIGAPFRSSDMSRPLLAHLPQGATPGAVIRVRALTSSGVSQGFRVVVGLSGRGQDPSDRGTPSRSPATILPAPTDARPGTPTRPASRTPNPPLRC